MTAHLRTEAYPVYRQRVYPAAEDRTRADALSYEANNARIDSAKRR
jgi:hypothetical protein